MRKALRHLSTGTFLQPVPVIIQEDYRNNEI
jgi:hypothetical protein